MKKKKKNEEEEEEEKEEEETALPLKFRVDTCRIQLVFLFVMWFASQGLVMLAFMWRP
jgi:hypothetical protein